jgi:hypothetical protein
MKQKLKNIYYFIKNLFNFSHPNLIHLKFSDCIFENNAYLLIEWKFEKAYRLNIKKLKYQSFHNQSCAYIILPNHISEIDLTFSNSWNSKKVKLKLRKSILDTQINYPIKTNFQSINTNKIIIKDIKLKEQNIKTNNIKIDIKNTNNPLKIKNLTYLVSNE